MTTRRLLPALALAVFLAPQSTRAAQVTIGAAKDTTIFQNRVDNSAGAGNGLFAGTNGQGLPRRGLIAFDVAAALPPGAVVQNVALSLTLGQAAGGGGGSQTIALHRLLSDWGEGVVLKADPPTNGIGGQGDGAAAGDGDATWNARMHSATTPTPWSAAGGDFLPASSAVASVGGTTNVATLWTSPALVADVQSWLTAPATNFGWLIKNADEASATNFRAFYSRDVATASFKPQLTITYVPEPSTAGLAIASLLAATRVRRRMPSSVGGPPRWAGTASFKPNRTLARCG